jgi:diaminohydroxyphosphoribosylaminopyrimidine deaminase/5-amino-6-(5-phosphoribosylamino)uracil reductase
MRRVTDAHFMQLALEQAARGRYSVSPNPMVGCVLTRDGKVIADGWHARAGEPHAEIKAIQTSDNVSGATMYVTLEPCVHHGRTPPCVDTIIASGIKRVVVAMQDPHEVVNGRGIERLRDAGIEVVTGVGESEARALNEKFLYSITARRPFVLLKAGMTFDGKLATVDRDSKWITSEGARQKSLELREEYDAILAGGGTIRADNPQLTRRLGWNGSITPWCRIVLDRDLVAPPTATVLTDGGPTMHVTHEVDLDAFLAELYERGIRSLIVEGGALVHAEFIRRKMWQKMIAFVAPMIVGGANAPSIFAGEAVRRLTDAYRFRFDRAELVGGDLMITAYPS